MIREMCFDDRELWSMFAELDAKARTKALRGALRASAVAVRRTAVKNFRSSGIRTSVYSERGIRAEISKNSLYYRVTVETRRDRTDYRGVGSVAAKVMKALRKKEVIPLWMEGGTVERRTRGIGFFSKKGSHSTGKLAALGFMEKTKRQEADRQTDNLRKNVEKYILKAVTRHGCTFS